MTHHRLLCHGQLCLIFLVMLHNTIEEQLQGCIVPSRAAWIAIRVSSSK